MLFPSTSLAARIERAESQFMADCATAAAGRRPASGVFVTPLAGGFATFTSAGSPLNKVAGLGFGGPLDPAALEAVERAFAERGSHVQVEVSTLGDPEVVQTLTKRGYVLQGFENVLGLALPRASAAAPPSGIEIAESPSGELDAWVDVVVTGFATADTQGVAAQESPERDLLAGVMADMASAAGLSLFVARRGGVTAGGGSLRLGGGVALLCGAATLPEHRRRGVQSALLGARLQIAADAGCDVAVVTTAPGSKSQENVQRQGFELLYARAVLVRTA
ncbi:MAG: GNAT family N-acetyltransferase [Vicinamibacteria bacterium]